MNYNLEKVTPYSVSERITSPDMVYLDWNESSYMSDLVVSNLQSKLTQLNQYPDPNNTLLKEQLSLYTKVDSEFIEAFNGSDSALDYTFRTLLNSKDRVLVPYPNYTQINQTIQSLGAYITFCDITLLEESIESHKPQMVYLSNPNNPTGYVYDIKSLVKKYSSIYFIVDEAYYEFYTDSSVFNLAYKLSNLIVTRTFSKGLGLAGVRLGYLTTNSYIINKIKTIKNFKEVNRIAEAAGIIALQNIEHIQKDISEMLKTKKKFLSQLKGVRTYDSYANFILIEHPRVKDIIEDLKQNNILVRDRSKFINNTIRITIGKPDVMAVVAKIINRHSI